MPKMYVYLIVLVKRVKKTFLMGDVYIFNRMIRRENIG